MNNEQMQSRVDKINSLLPRLSDAWDRDRLMRERRTLLRQIHNIPVQIQLPVDWQP